MYDIGMLFGVLILAPSNSTRPKLIRESGIVSVSISISITAGRPELRAFFTAPSISSFFLTFAPDSDGVFLPIYIEISYRASSDNLNPDSISTATIVLLRRANFGSK
jgi:hypothetical protein